MNASAPLLSERFPAPRPATGSKFLPSMFSDFRLGIFRSKNPMFDGLLESRVELREKVEELIHLRIGRGKTKFLYLTGTSLSIIPMPMPGNQHIEFNIFRLANAAFPKNFPKPRALRFSGEGKDSHGHIYFEFKPTPLPSPNTSQTGRKKPQQITEYRGGEGMDVFHPSLPTGIKLPQAEGDFRGFGFCLAGSFPNELKRLNDAGITVSEDSPAFVQGGHPVFIEITEVNPEKLHSFINEIKAPEAKKKAMVALALFAGSLMAHQAEAYPDIDRYMGYGYGAYVRKFKNNPALFARVLARSASYWADRKGEWSPNLLGELERKRWNINDFLKEYELVLAYNFYLKKPSP